MSEQPNTTPDMPDLVNIPDIQAVTNDGNVSDGNAENNNEPGTTGDENQSEDEAPSPNNPSDFGIDDQQFAEQNFETFALAKEALETWAKEFGFAVKGKKKYALTITGGTNQDFHWARGGVYVKSASAAQAPQRKVTTQLTDCKWKAQTRKETAQSNYTIRFLRVMHNHRPTGDVRIYPQARQSQNPELAAFVNNHLKAGTKARDLLRAVKKQHPTCNFRIGDIYNKISSHKRDLLEGEDEMSALVRDIDRDGAMHRTKVDASNNLSHILIIPSAIPKIVKAERTTPVLQMDGTFRTNKYGIQMFHIVAHTKDYKTYTVAYCFMSTITQEDYEWVLQPCIDFGVVAEPKAILTDAEGALINAVEAIFPESRHMLCVWHIVMNILAHHKKDFPAVSALDDAMFSWDQFEKRIFNLFLNSATEEVFDRDWADIRGKIEEQVAEYIQNIWIDVHKERFCEPWLRNVMHLGQRHTSRVESGHRSVKSALGSANQGLFAIYIKLRTRSEEQLEDAGFNTERQEGVPRTAVPDILAEVDGLVSNKASVLLQQQVEKAKIELTKERQTAGQHDPSECSHTFTRTYGLPCSHTLLDILRRGDRIEAESITMPFWFLDEKSASRKRPAPFRPPLVKGKNVTGSGSFILAAGGRMTCVIGP